MTAKPHFDTFGTRLYYRKEKLRGASWEYEINGGWFTVSVDGVERRILRHGFRFFRPREATIVTAAGQDIVQRRFAEQWFFPDRWFSLLRFVADDNRTIGYYVNFSKPLEEIRSNYYADIDLELDLWIDLNGTVTELDRDEYEAELESGRLDPVWSAHVEDAARQIQQTVHELVAKYGPDIEQRKDPVYGIPEFILLT
ncbi:MAG: DUF402 domain-containing protein [Thermomicrobiales bacterium]|nr:DUF402 domain-containing protein [Thermomicrobiales bacterium]